MTGGEKIRAERLQRNLTQRDLERMTGIRDTTLSAIETGRHGIGRRWAALLGLALDIDPSELITFPDVALKDTGV